MIQYSHDRRAPKATSYKQEKLASKTASWVYRLLPVFSPSWLWQSLGWITSISLHSLKRIAFEVTALLSMFTNLNNLSPICFWFLSHLSPHSSSKSFGIPATFENARLSTANPSYNNLLTARSLDIISGLPALTFNANWYKLTTTLLSTIMLLAVYLTSLPSFALPSDRQKVIEIKSDSADINNKTGVSIYRGNVVMTQGTTQITGSIITIYTANHEITNVTAQGNEKRAHYEEQQDDNSITQAWGYIIKYGVSDDLIELIGKAKFSQKGDIFTGEKISYDMVQKEISAKGSMNKDDNGRIQMIIQPKH